MKVLTNGAGFDNDVAAVLVTVEEDLGLTPEAAIPILMRAAVQLARLTVDPEQALNEAVRYLED